MGPSTGQVDRLRVLVDSGIALSSELSLDALLQRIVEAAAQLTGARYAALGVIDRSGQGARALPDDRDRRRDARGDRRPAQRGRGILGVLIREARTLRLHDLADDPRSVGFPRHHPPMKTFLGVPILLRGVGLREPLPDGEGRRRGLHRGGRGADSAPGGPGCGRDRERAPLRGVDAVAAPARVAQRDRGRARLGARARAAAGAGRPPPAGARGRAAGADRAPG